jgi:hypothetical protein
MAERDAPPFSGPAEPEPSRGPWLGLGIGFALIAAIVGYLIYSGTTNSPNRSSVPSINQAATPDPYAANLTISDLAMAEAANLIGGTALYVEGKIKNNGDKTVTGATAEVTFLNSLNQVVQRESHPVMVIIATEPAEDIAALNMAPLRSGQQRDFRLIFERISADWNRMHPQVRITTVTTR